MRHDDCRCGVGGGAWLWTTFGSKVAERAGKLLGDAGRHTYEKIDWQRAAERYRQEMQMLYGTMRIIGMAEPVALADIFTHVFLLDKPSAWRRYDIEQLQLRMELDDHDALAELQLRMELDDHDARLLRRRDAFDLLNQHQRLMILGNPGAGKTTLLKHLVLHWALEAPLLERLADYLAASERMLECLDLAAVADRDAIRNRLLLPPQP